MTAPSFPLDRFQVEAMAAIDAGANVLVAAPTGAGKTVVAEHAVAVAMASGRRCYYTTPIKALSNQKFRDLRRIHGQDAVGLLTGDNTVNPDAPVVVMTTEVLRNMIYASSPALDDLAWVVLDEVHYLQDRYRGSVWEEVVIHAPGHIGFVCLSATVSNAQELADWIGTSRGHTEVVVETERPVELVNHFLVRDMTSGDLVQVETLVDGRPNPDGSRFDRSFRPVSQRTRYRGREPRRYGTPRRPEVVEHLRGADLLPAIVFVFSRAGCEDAVRAVTAERLDLTTSAERRRIRRILGSHVAHMSDDDLLTVGFDEWSRAVQSGVAAHHAGMVPPLKEAVEECFLRGLVKVVFATETLALGINMPARSVVIEALSKFTGDHHEDLTPSQYTQLTGRAGRRGIDPVGHAVVLWSPWNTFDKVAALAASREYVLRSAFRPTPNMVVNLLRRYDRERAAELLARSFAQFHTDRSIARMLARRARLAERLATADAEAGCELGDVRGYLDLRRAEENRWRVERERLADHVEAAITTLVPGDVVRHRGRDLAVLSVAHRRGVARVRVLDSRAAVRDLSPEDFDDVPTAVGSCDVPEPFDPNNRIIQRRMAASLKRPSTGTSPAQRTSEGAERDGREPRVDASSRHPVANCPGLAAHIEALAEKDRLNARLKALDRRTAASGRSLQQQFDRLAALLERHGFIDGWELTDRGDVLAGIFHENDLLCALAICGGAFDGLSTVELAAVASCLTYEHRSKEPPPAPRYPTPTVRERCSAVIALGAELARESARAGVAVGSEADPSFVAAAYEWASGNGLPAVLDGCGLGPGDFVRNVKVLVDLLGQIAKVAPVAQTRRNAASASEALSRGIIAVSSGIGSDDERVVE